MVGYLAPVRPRAEVIANLAEAAGVTSDCFEPLIAPRRGSGVVRVSIRGTDVPRGFLDTSCARLCQMCLRQAQIIPAEWDFALWKACPCHGVRLLSRCPQCDQVITWKRSNLDRCGNQDCMFVFSQGATTMAPDSELTLPIFVSRAMGFETLPSHPDLNGIFEHPTASEALNIIYSIGVIAKSLSKGGRSLPRLRIQEDAEHVLTDWPNNFNALVERASASSDLKESNHIYRIFDQTAGHDRMRPAHAATLRNAIFLASGRGPTRGPSSDSRHKVGTDPPKFVTQNAAAHLLKISRRIVKKLFRDGKIEGYTKTGKTGIEYLFIDINSISSEKLRRDKFVDIQSQRDLYLSISEIYLNFGIWPRALHDLESCSLVCRSSQHDSTIYVKQSFLDLFRALSEKCQKQNESIAIGNDTVTLKKICRRFDVPLINVVQAILCGELIPECHYLKRIGLDSIGVARAEIVKFSVRYRGSLGAIQRRHAAACLGVPKSEVKILLDKGYLNEIDVKSSRPFNYLSIDSLQTFKSKFVSTVFIAKLTGIRGEYLKRNFRKLNIAPHISGADSKSTDYWSWSDLEAKLPEAESWRRTFLGRHCFV